MYHKTLRRTFYRGKQDVCVEASPLTYLHFLSFYFLLFIPKSYSAKKSLTTSSKWSNESCNRLQVATKPSILCLSFERSLADATIVAVPSRSKSEYATMPYDTRIFSPAVNFSSTIPYVIVLFII